jgi:hypothetical protein
VKIIHMLSLLVATDFDRDPQAMLLLELQPSVPVSEALRLWFTHATAIGLVWASTGRAG